MKVASIAYLKTEIEPRFCLITNKQNLFTFPKGNVRKGEKLTTAALRELYEEAGVYGKIKTKYGTLFSNKPEILYFFVKIEKVKKRWPEKKYRTRCFLTLHEILLIETNVYTKKIVKELLNLNSNRELKTYNQINNLKINSDFVSSINPSNLI